MSLRFFNHDCSNARTLSYLEHVWSQLENRAQADGGELVLMGAHDSAGQQPVLTSGSRRTAQRPGPSAPLTMGSRPAPSGKSHS